MVTPIPTTSVISGRNDLRPISVTSFFSRVTERLVIHKYVMPFIDCAVFLDQYAFKPTGRTTCAIVDIIHRISLLIGSQLCVMPIHIL